MVAKLTMLFSAGVLQQAPASWRTRGRSAHVASRSDKDSAVCSLLAALVVLGSISRRRAATLAQAVDDECETPCVALRKAIDVDVIGSDLSASVTAVARQMTVGLCSGSMRKVLAFTVARIRGGAVVLLRVEQDSFEGGHWTVALGIERLDTGSARTPSAILCLDSTEQSPGCAPFNTRLDLLSPNPGARFAHYRRPGGRIHSVTCSEAVAISSPSKPAGARYGR